MMIPIIKRIDSSLEMLKGLKKSLGDFILAGTVMNCPKIAEAINILDILEKDWQHILDDICRLKGKLL